MRTLAYSNNGRLATLKDAEDNLADVIQGGGAWGIGGELGVQNSNLVTDSATFGAGGRAGAYVAAGRQASATLATGTLGCSS